MHGQARSVDADGEVIADCGSFSAAFMALVVIPDQGMADIFYVHLVVRNHRAKPAAVVVETQSTASAAVM
jgi:hypothetical protein